MWGNTENTLQAEENKDDKGKSIPRPLHMLLEILPKVLVFNFMDI